MTVNDIKIRNSDGDFESVFPIPLSQGGTGATTSEDAWAALHPANTTRIVNQTTTTDTGYGIAKDGDSVARFLMGLDRGNAGIYDDRLNRWMIYSDGSEIHHAGISYGSASTATSSTSTSGTSYSGTIDWNWVKIHDLYLLEAYGVIPFAGGNDYVRLCYVNFPVEFYTTPAMIGGRVQNGNSQWEIETIFEVQSVGKKAAAVCLKVPSLEKGYLASQPTWDDVSLLVCGIAGEA